MKEKCEWLSESLPREGKKRKKRKLSAKVLKPKALKVKNKDTGAMTRKAILASLDQLSMAMKGLAMEMGKVAKAQCQLANVIKWSAHALKQILKECWWFDTPRCSDSEKSKEGSEPEAALVKYDEEAVVL